MHFRNWVVELIASDVHIKISELLTWPAEKITEFMHMAYQIDEETMSGLNPDRSLYDPSFVFSNLVPPVTTFLNSDSLQIIHQIRCREFREPQLRWRCLVRERWRATGGVEKD